MPRFPWTHYFERPDSGRITGFAMESCETCGAPIQAPNAVTLVESPAKLQSMGLTPLSLLPAEGWFDEDTGMEVCDNCYA